MMTLLEMYKEELAEANKPVYVRVDWDFGKDLEEYSEKPSTVVKVPNDVYVEYQDILVNENELAAKEYLDEWLTDEYGFLHNGWSWK